MRTTCGLALLSLAIAACSSAPSSENAAQSGEDVTIAAPFAGAGYYQIDYAQPSAKEISLLSLAPNKSFWGERCVDSACNNVEGIQGAYTYTKTKLRLYDAHGALVGQYWYALDQGTLWLEQVGSRDAYPLDTMSEDLCDTSGGGWSDDDLGAHGFNCSCPAGQDWGPGGCDGCAYGSCASQPCGKGLTRCGTACVDTSSDATNCGACNSYCTKAQKCVKGACQ
jgi:hypothetical protein